MSRELVAIAPRVPVLRDYDEPALGERQIRIRTELASPKHGTELVGYRDDPVASRTYDPVWGAVMPRPLEDASPRFPRPLGNSPPCARRQSVMRFFVAPQGERDALRVPRLPLTTRCQPRRTR